MSLRVQLLAFGLLTLVLPWIGLRYVREMENALRGGLEQFLVGSATTVAAALEEQGVAVCAAPDCIPPLARTGTTIYAAPLVSEPPLDGVRAEDWNLPDRAAVTLGRVGAVKSPPQYDRGWSPIAKAPMRLETWTPMPPL